VFGELGYAEYVEVDVSARDQLLRVRRDLSQPLSWNITHSAGRYGVHFFIQQWEP
jgi:hypothetical protein